MHAQHNAARTAPHLRPRRGSARACAPLLWQREVVDDGQEATSQDQGGEQPWRVDSYGSGSRKGGDQGQQLHGRKGQKNN